MKIPMERVGVLLGKQGEVRKRIEENTKTQIEVDSKSGDITIHEGEANDPLLILKCADIIKAIGRGFSPDKAFRLLNDDIYFELTDIRDYVGKNQKHIRRVRARVIGSKGRTRKLIEELTGTNVSVYGNTIGVIGEALELKIAVQALDMLLKGSEHAVVYKFLERSRSKIKMSDMDL
jgi:ribosomal RNA assembly protein